MNIQTYQIPVDNILVDNIVDLSKVIPSAKASNSGGWQGVVKDENIDWVEKLKKTIETVTKQKTERFWFNINGPGHSNKWHRHFIDCNVAVLYIKVPPNSGNIEFRNNDQIEVITPTAGQLLVFPGTLEHRVTDNESQDIRISLATNLK